ncbi:DUF817 domain-containing protein [Beijerinckia sp. L45]|uniref:DUF817 domain-containing protein n=1 Tax=Beijerinckia sp. L45 TaxID=1641855 RepID=UPI001576B8A8|nr:DUF817 domain-containing protein [Beijerinckia sp. L45]
MHHVILLRGSSRLSTSASRSAATRWPPLARFIALDERLGVAAEARGPWSLAAYEFIRFGLKQGWACLFGGVLLGLIIATRLWYPAGAALARYDALFLAAIAIQALLLATRLETLEEAKVILVFHVIGTAMEVHKTAVGSWIYPEASLFHIGGVPLFTGFMYAAVGSYLARVWRLFDFRFARHPSLLAITLLSIAIYINFLTNHAFVDMRIVLLAATAILFARTTIFFKVWRVHRRMPLLLGFGLVALFIWFAENIGTVTGTWLYPRQMAHWSMVPASKLTSCLLLMIVSYTLVARINGVRTVDSAKREPLAEERLLRSDA